MNVKTDAGVTTGVDPSTGEKKVIKNTRPPGAFKDALDIPGSTTKTPAANAAATGTANNEYSDDQLNTLIQIQNKEKFQGDGGRFSGMGDTPDKWRTKMNNMTPEELRRFMIKARRALGN